MIKTVYVTCATYTSFFGKAFARTPLMVTANFLDMASKRGASPAAADVRNSCTFPFGNIQELAVPMTNQIVFWI